MAVVALWAVTNGTAGFGQTAGLANNEEIKVFPLGNLEPEEASGILMRLFGHDSGISPIRFAVDKRSNSLIVKGSKTTLDNVSQVLKTIDVKAEKKSWISFYSLKHASAVDIQGLIAQSVPSSIVQAESRTNSVLVEVSSQVDESKASDLIKLLDLPTSVEPKDVSIRIVWLVDKSLTKDGAEAVPADLERPIEALRKKLSLGELRLASQAMVRCSPKRNSQFTAAGSAALNRRYTIDFQGEVTQKGDNAYQLNVSGSTSDPETGNVACRLQTSCANAALGKPIIIGTTSVESKPSVFVVQIIED